LEHQTNFTFLPGYLQNIVLNYNFSIVRSETWVATSKIVYDPLPYPPFQVPRLVLYESKQKLEGQPEIYGNIALGYDIGGFSARISFFYQGEYVRQFSVDGRNDRVQGSYTRLDFIVKQQITDKISMFLNVNNFTNYKEEDFLKNRSGLWNLLDTSQLYGLTADLGIRITF
jgi:outer membrane receptor protein involved in Fe transport